MKSIYYIILTALIASGTLIACKRTKEEFIGPEYVAASSSFSAGSFCAKKVGGSTCLTLGDEIRFGLASPEAMTLDITLSERVTWTVTITGQSSNAYKIITGTSSVINSSTFTWDGGPSVEAYRFFELGETCDVVVSFLGTDITVSGQVKIGSTSTGPKDYDGINVQHNGVYYRLVEDFDINTPLARQMRTSYVDIADGSENEIYTTKAVNGVTPVNGSFMMRFKGLDVNNNTYLGGTGAELLTSHPKQILTNDPDKLYFNMYVYGTGKINSNLQIRSYEWDTLDAARVFEAGYFMPNTIVYSIEQQKTNDQWTYDLYIDWVGWKLVSIKYSMFKPSSNPDVGGSGNRVAEPIKITSWALLLQSMPLEGSQVDCYVDMIQLTENGPFVP